MSEKLHRCNFAMALRIAALTVAAPFLLLTAGIRLNLTPSEPVGLYKLEPLLDSTQLERGDLLAVCLPEPIAREGLARGRLRSGACPTGSAPVLKRLAAFDSDVVLVTARGVLVGPTPSLVPCSAPIQPALAARRGSTGRRGLLWLLGQHGRSWDSRYYGPIPAAAVLARARPLWVAASSCS